MRMKGVAISSVLVLLLSPWVGTEEKKATETEELWYVLEVQGKRAGWMKYLAEEGRDRARLEQEMELSFRRGGTPITLEMKTITVETPTGEPISSRTTQRFSRRTIETRVAFKPDGLHVTTRQGNRETRDVRPPIPGEWMMPVAAGRYFERQLDEGKKEISVRVFDPHTGPSAPKMTFKVIGRETIEVFGREVEAVKLAVTMSNLPGVEMIQYTDESSNPLKMELNLGFLTVTVLAADKQLALSELSPPEIMASTLIECDRSIRDPRRLRTATYKVRSREGRLPDLPETTVQAFQRIDEERGRISIDLGRNRAAATPAPEVRHTVMADGRDEKIIELAKEATRGAGEDPAARAEAMRRWVNRHVREKDLSVGLATASEVARTGTGDCTEHAVLLAAMLRASAIPSRVASGVIYVESFLGKKNVFAFHMWTQAWLPGEKGWCDLDATLGEETPFDATHVALAVSDLSGGAIDNQLVELAPLIGRLEIEPAPADGTEGHGSNRAYRRKDLRRRGSGHRSSGPETGRTVRRLLDPPGPVDDNPDGAGGRVPGSRNVRGHLESTPSL